MARHQRAAGRGKVTVMGRPALSIGCAASKSTRTPKSRSARSRSVSATRGVNSARVLIDWMRPRKARSGKPSSRGGDGLAHAQGGKHRLAHVHARVGVRGVAHGHHRLAGGDHLARLGVAAQHHARGGGQQREVGRGGARGLQRGAGAGGLGARGVDLLAAWAGAHGGQHLARGVAAAGGHARGGLRHVELLAADGVVRGQRAQPLHVAGGAVGLGLGSTGVGMGAGHVLGARAGLQLGQPGLGLLQRGLAHAHVSRHHGLRERGQRVARAHLVALAHVHGHHARGLQRRRVVLRDLQRARGRGSVVAALACRQRERGAATAESDGGRAVDRSRRGRDRSARHRPRNEGERRGRRRRAGRARMRAEASDGDDGRAEGHGRLRVGRWAAPRAPRGRRRRRGARRPAAARRWRGRLPPSSTPIPGRTMWV